MSRYASTLTPKRAGKPKKKWSLPSKQEMAVEQLSYGFLNCPVLESVDASRPDDAAAEDTSKASRCARTRLAQSPRCCL